MLGTADVKGSYDGVLPALNTVLELTPDVLLRFSATQNLNRPTLGSMAAQGSASNDTGVITASRGNPDLKPFTDTTLDFAVEYYFGKVGLLSAGVFQKYVKNFITTMTLTSLMVMQRPSRRPGFLPPSFRARRRIPSLISFRCRSISRAPRG